MITQLAFLDLAAKACPPRVEGTFFALLMSVFNGGTQLSQNVGGASTTGRLHAARVHLGGDDGAGVAAGPAGQHRPHRGRRRAPRLSTPARSVTAPSARGLVLSAGLAGRALAGPPRSARRSQRSARAMSSASSTSISIQPGGRKRRCGRTPSSAPARWACSGSGSRTQRSCSRGAQRKAREERLAHEVAPAPEHGRDAHAAANRPASSLSRARGPGASALEPRRVGPSCARVRDSGGATACGSTSASSGPMAGVAHSAIDSLCAAMRKDTVRNSAKEDDSGVPDYRLVDVGRCPRAFAPVKGRPGSSRPPFLRVSGRPPRSADRRARTPCGRGARRRCDAPCTSTPCPAIRRRARSTPATGRSRPCPTSCARPASRSRARARSRTCSSTR